MDYISDYKMFYEFQKKLQEEIDKMKNEELFDEFLLSASVLDVSCNDEDDWRVRILDGNIRNRLHGWFNEDK